LLSLEVEVGAEKVMAVAAVQVVIKQRLALAYRLE
jgi:hypothetical protein